MIINYDLARIYTVMGKDSRGTPVFGVNRQLAQHMKVFEGMFLSRENNLQAGYGIPGAEELQRRAGLE